MSTRTDPADELSLAEAFTREHHEIDAGIEQYLSGGTGQGARTRVEPLLDAMHALRRHIYLDEEPVIYPHLDADLDAAEQERVRELLDSGTLPDGWVCQRA